MSSFIFKNFQEMYDTISICRSLSVSARALPILMASLSTKKKGRDNCWVKVWNGY